jgi:hypothetical protein
VAVALLLGAGGEEGGGRVVQGDEVQHEAGRVSPRELFEDDRLLGEVVAASPARRPVREGVSAVLELVEPRSLEADELVVPDAGLLPPPVRGYVGGAPPPDMVAQLVRHHLNDIAESAGLR